MRDNWPDVLLGSENAKMNKSLPSWGVEPDDRRLSKDVLLSYERKLVSTFNLDFPKSLAVAEGSFFFVKSKVAGVKDHDQLNVSVILEAGARSLFLTLYFSIYFSTYFMFPCVSFWFISSCSFFVFLIIYL